MNARHPARCGALCATLLLPVIAHAFTDIGAGLEGVQSSAAAWGDYDNDGDLDLVLSGEMSGGIRISRIYRNDAGTYTDIGAGLTGVSQGSLDWGDMDNDGDLDLLLTGHDGSTPVSKVYRNDVGTFTDIGAGLEGVYWSDADWGDYDNDGDLDLVIAGIDYSDAEITSLYRNDAGSFAWVSTNLEQLADSAVDWGDYDNDGDLDIVLAGFGQTGRESYIYRNDAGSFTDIGAPLEGTRDGSANWGDYDNDGDLDLLLTGQINGGGAVSLVYRNSGGVFTNIGAGLPALLGSDADWGDYDNDGDLDILIAGFNGSTSISRIYRNNAGVFVDSGISLPGVSSGSVAWGDYDNDRRLDALITGPISVIYGNTVAPVNTPPSTPGGLAVSLLPGKVVFSWSAASDAETPASGLSYNLRVGSTQGGNEIVASMSGASGLRQIPAIGNRGATLSWELDVTDHAGEFLYWSVQAVDAGFLGSPFASELSVGGFVNIGAAVEPVHNSAVAWGDYDDDGDLDFCLTGWSATLGPVSRVYRNTSGVFSVVADLEGIRHAGVAWGDYDNDGDLDLLISGWNAFNDRIARLYRNDGGSFTNLGEVVEGVVTASAAWGDFDNDGDLDILLTGYDDTNVRLSRVYRNDDGAFVDILAGLEGVGDGSAAWGDYDNDGDLDILLTGRNASILPVSHVYRNDAGTFNDIGAGLSGFFRSSVAWGDYDNDGDLDILATGAIGNGASIIYRNDAGTFTDIGAGLFGVMYSSAAWGDYDNDGDLDVLLTGTSDTGASRVTVSRIYRNDAGSFTDTGMPLEDVYRSSVAWGDYDNDGDLDILLTGENPSGAYVSRIYRNDALVANTAPTAPSLIGVSQYAGVATFSWTAANDDQTPPDGLSYNLRVGTTPGGSEISAAMADLSNGYRRIPALGNSRQQLAWSLDLSSLADGTTLYWSVQSVDTGFAGSPFAPEQSVGLDTATATPALPARFALHPNVPNPFNPSTQISFELPVAGRVELKVYDLSGALVRTLQAGSMPLGRHSVSWDGRDSSDKAVASGTYLYRLRAGEIRETRKMTLLK